VDAVLPWALEDLLATRGTQAMIPESSAIAWTSPSRRQQRKPPSLTSLKSISQLTSDEPSISPWCWTHALSMISTFLLAQKIEHHHEQQTLWTRLPQFPACLWSDRSFLLPRAPVHSLQGSEIESASPSKHSHHTRESSSSARLARAGVCLCPTPLKKNCEAEATMHSPLRNASPL